MKAIQITSIGSPDVLEYRTMPGPLSGRDEVLIPVQTSGVNSIDMYF